MESEAEVPSLPTGCTYVRLREEEVKVPLVVQLYSQEVFYDFCTKRKETPCAAHLKCFSAVCVVPSIPFSLSAFSSAPSLPSIRMARITIAFLPRTPRLQLFAVFVCLRLDAILDLKLKLPSSALWSGQTGIMMRVKVHWDMGCVPCARVIAQLGLTLLYVLGERSHGPEREGGR